MTVKEFIKLLERMPQNMEINIPIPDGTTTYSSSVTIYIYQNKVEIEGE